MKLTLITSVFSGIENHRLQEEASRLDHTLSILDPRSLAVSITDGKLTIPELDKTEPQIVILRGVLHSIRSVSAMISYCRVKGIKVFHNNLERTQYSIHKTADLIKLASAGIKTPDSRVTEVFELLPDLALELGYPIIAKPIAAGKGIGVTMIHDEPEFDQYLEMKRQMKKTKAKNILLQKFVPYQHDLRVLVIGDHTFCMERIPKAGDFRANFSLGGSVKVFQLDDESHQLAIKALKSIDMSVGGVDILITESGEKYILEVNHSPGFQGMEEATGENIAAIFITHAISSAR